MKLLLASLLPALALLLATPNLRATDEQDLLTEAQRAYMNGDNATAKLRFNQVLELDPSNVTAKNYLRMIKTAEAKEGGPSPLQQQLESLIMSKVELKDATFGAALDYLKQTATRESGGKVNVSFVMHVPPDFANTQKVTLSLNGIPFTEVLRYMGDLAGVDFKIEKYAVFVTKKGGADTDAQGGTPAAPATP